MPLAAASALKSASHASKLPVPHGTAAIEVVGNKTPTASARRRKRRGIKGRLLRNRFADRKDNRMRLNVCGNRGQNKAWPDRMAASRPDPHLAPPANQ